MSMGTQPFLDAIALFRSNAAAINPRYRKLDVVICPINNGQQVKIQINEGAGPKVPVLLDIECSNRPASGIYEIMQVVLAGFLSALRYAEQVNPRMQMHKINDAREAAHEARMAKGTPSTTATAKPITVSATVPDTDEEVFEANDGEDGEDDLDGCEDEDDTN